MFVVYSIHTYTYIEIICHVYVLNRLPLHHAWQNTWLACAPWASLIFHIIIRATTSNIFYICRLQIVYHPPHVRGAHGKRMQKTRQKRKLQNVPKKKKWYGVQKAYLPAPRHKLSHVKDLAFALWAQWVAQHNADIYFLVARCGCYLHIFMLRQVEINGGAIIFEINFFFLQKSSKKINVSNKNINFVE